VRPHSSLGNCPPAEFVKGLVTKQEPFAAAN
jgi:hypothetical protein